jgi:hypothetical protein
VCHLTTTWKDVPAFMKKPINEKVKILLTEIMKTFYCCHGNKAHHMEDTHVRAC